MARAYEPIQAQGPAGRTLVIMPPPRDAPALPRSDAMTPIPLQRFKKPLIIAAGVFASLLLLAAIAAVLIYPTLPDLSELTDYHPKLPLRVYTSDEVLMGEYGAERRDYLPLDQIPKRMQDALLATEDAAFYEHGAISYVGVLRAAVNNLFGRHLQGASTITQQLARDAYLTKHKGDYKRKFVEALLSYKIESELPKQKILEIYMNQIYLGQRAYGFSAAARAYFGKPLKDLSIAETAMLAGLPQNPNFANPVANFTRATKRQREVIQRMRETGVITDAEAEAARAEKLHIRSASDVRLHAEYAAEMVRQTIVAQYGESSYARGLKVYTSIVSNEQDAAYHSLRKSLMDLERRKAYRGPEGHIDLPSDADEEDAAITQALADHPDNDDLRSAVVTEASPTKVLASLQTGEDLTITGEGLSGVRAALSPKARDEIRIERGSIIRVQRGAPSKAAPQGAWLIAQAPEAEGAFVAMEPASGRVHALVGGFDFARNQFNHVTQAWRQPGSSFKPVVYSAALEQGLTPNTIVDDAPITIGDWSPKNYEDTYDGPLPVHRGLALSKNVVTVRVLQWLGVAKARDWAAHFGLDEDKQPDNLTLALGSGSVTPMQMLGVYSVFANGGVRGTPVLIQRIVDGDGKVLFEAKPPAAPDENLRAITPRNAFVMDTLLQEVARSGTAARAQATLHRPDIYGKTGTTNESVDAWFCGFQPNLVGVAWIGYDQPRGLGDRESGGGLALPVWVDYMSVALKNIPVQEITPPDGVVQDGEGWVFDEFAGSAGLRYIGDAPPAEAAGAASAASAP